MAIGYGSDQPRTTYSDTNIGQRVIADQISLISPKDTPFLARFAPGSANSKFNLRDGGTKIEWSEDALAATSGASASSCASADTTITVSDASYFNVGDVCKIDSEYVRITSVATSTNIVTVTRNVAGTQATHSSTATWTIVTNARLEGADTSYGPTTTVDQPYNYVQELQDAVKVTEIQMRRLQYGVTNELDRQRDKKVAELNKKLENALIHLTDLRTGPYSSTVAQIMGGLGAFITTAGNYTTTGTTITKANIDNTMLACFQDGGSPTILMANPSSIMSIRNLIDSSSFVNVSQSERSMGMVIERVVTQYGELDLLSNRWMGLQDALLLDEEYIGTYQYGEGWREKDIPATGQYVAREIVGDFSLVVQQGTLAHGRIYTTLTTGL